MMLCIHLIRSNVLQECIRNMWLWADIVFSVSLAADLNWEIV